MQQAYRTLKETVAEISGTSYQKAHRAVSALREAGLVEPWHGENNELRLTFDHALRLKRFLGFLRNGETVKSAIPKLENDILRRQLAALEEENQGLRALVEWKPRWWVKVLRLVVPRRSRLGTRVWSRTAPEPKAG